MVSSPCTTFSVMRRPRLRSVDKPFGFNTQDPQTSTENILDQRGAQLKYVAATNDAAGIMETTCSSYLQHLPGWKIVRSRPAQRKSDAIRVLLVQCTASPSVFWASTSPWSYCPSGAAAIINTYALREHIPKLQLHTLRIWLRRWRTVFMRLCWRYKGVETKTYPFRLLA